MALSARIKGIEPSRTAHFAAEVARLRAKGTPVLNLAIGEPHEPVANTIVAATRDA